MRHAYPSLGNSLNLTYFKDRQQALRPDVLGNKAKRGREAPVPADLVESLADLKSFHRRERNRPCFDISRQWVSKSMEEEAVATGIDPARD